MMLVVYGFKQEKRWSHRTVSLRRRIRNKDRTTTVMHGCLDGCSHLYARPQEDDRDARLKTRYGVSGQFDGKLLLRYQRLLSVHVGFVATSVEELASAKTPSKGGGVYERLFPSCGSP